MDNSEEYVLQVFRRAQMMLEDVLMPEHVTKLLKLGERLAQTSDLHAEAASLKFTEGFSKAGIAFEWLLGRSKRDIEFTLEQFDTDVHVLFEILLTAFRSESHEPVAWEHAPAPGGGTSFGLPEPDWNFGASRTAASAESAPAPEAETEMPSFMDLLDHPMLLTVRRLADSAAAFDQKPVPERATSLAVLKMMAKSVVDMARPQNKVVVTGAFQEIAGLMESIERKGRARESETEKIVTELGQKLSTALVDMAGGIKHMNEIMEFINERKEPGVK
jgi:hypothetical protein